MYNKYTDRLFSENLTVVEFLEHCSDIFSARIDTKPAISITPISAKDNKSIGVEEAALEDLQDEAAELRFMTNEQKLEYGHQKRSTEIASYEHSILDGILVKNMLVEMEEQVNQWNAPNPEFEVLKDFVLLQLRNTIIDHNEDIAHYESELRICQERAPIDYYKQSVYRVKRDIEFCEKSIQDKLEISAQTVC